MTRFAVVGHVEWIEFGTFDHVPEPFSMPVLMQQVRRALRG